MRVEVERNSPATLDNYERNLIALNYNPWTCGLFRLGGAGVKLGPLTLQVWCWRLAGIRAALHVSWMCVYSIEWRLVR